MKNFFLALVYFWVSIATAADPPVSIKGQSGTKQVPKWNLQVPFYQATNLGGIDALIETGNKNLLQDPGMESTSTSAWVASAGSIAKTTTAANVAFGARSTALTPPGSNAALRSVAITPPDALRGTSGYASCWVKGGTTNNFL